MDDDKVFFLTLKIVSLFIQAGFGNEALTTEACHINSCC